MFSHGRLLQKGKSSIDVFISSLNFKFQKLNHKTLHIHNFHHFTPFHSHSSYPFHYSQHFQPHHLPCLSTFDPCPHQPLILLSVSLSVSLEALLRLDDVIFCHQAQSCYHHNHLVWACDFCYVDWALVFSPCRRSSKCLNFPPRLALVYQCFPYGRGLCVSNLSFASCRTWNWFPSGVPTLLVWYSCLQARSHCLSNVVLNACQSLIAIWFGPGSSVVTWSPFHSSSFEEPLEVSR